MLGHDGPPTQFWSENLLTGAPLQRCPIRDLLDAGENTPELFAEVERYLLTYYPAYREGHLLVAGGVADQPARYLEMMNTIRNLEDQTDAKYLELTKERTPDGHSR